MLTSLSIQNYALISRLEIDFHPGFSVLTGETGAGKSIILGALSLILGQRADTKSIKQGANKCVIEGVFNISSYQLEDFFNQKEWDYDTRYCIIRREIFDNGKSRAFINDVPVGLSDLKELVSLLIDVHSQHQNLMLGDNHFQMQVIDVLSGHPELFATYKKTYSEYVSLKKELNALQKEASESTQEEDYLRFQIQQLEEANLVSGEQTQLEQDIETLSHVEEIKGNLFRLSQLLSDEEQGTVLFLKESLSVTQSLQKIYPDAKEIQERLETSYIDLKELSREISNKEEALEYDPERLNVLNERLNMIFSLQQKHRVSTIEELIEIRDSMSKKIQAIEHFDEQISILQKQTETAYENVLSIASQLSQIRQEASSILEKKLTEKARFLGMPNMNFMCQLEKKNSPDHSGFDNITFLFSANKNVALQSVSQIASGGEISRLMLCIKALIADSTTLPTIIFDEIDSGVSGEIADKMGEIMKEMGNVMQVITITHLPQIAAKGSNHYFVFKEETENSTETHIRQLKQEERIKEVAQMLSGSELSNAALENAKNLLNL